MNSIFTIDFNQYIVLSEIRSKFEDITVEFHDDVASLKCILAHDIAHEILTTFHAFLTRVLNGDLYLPGHIDSSKGIGYYWNEWASRLPERGDYEPDYAEGFWLWSTKEVATWLYAIPEGVYLEIGPVYRWHFEDPGQIAGTSYTDFIANYKTILQVIIKHEKLLEWKLQCENLISKI